MDKFDHLALLEIDLLVGDDLHVVDILLSVELYYQLMEFGLLDMSKVWMDLLLYELLMLGRDHDLDLCLGMVVQRVL